MYQRRYLMSVKSLAEHTDDKNLWANMTEYMDRDRKGKLERLKNPGKRAACAGAGLLLQWAYFQYFKFAGHMQDADSCAVSSGKSGVRTKDSITEKDPEVIVVSPEDVLDKIKSPFNFTIYKEKNGKPYIKDHPFFYNMSHSGDYVFCAVSDESIGADIQRRSDTDYMKLAERFFSDEEKAAVGNCADIRQRNALFYRLWCRKEALGKLSGEGIASSVGCSLLDIRSGPADGYIWEEYEILTDYQIVVCRYNIERHD